MASVAHRRLCFPSLVSVFRQTLSVSFGLLVSFVVGRNGGLVSSPMITLLCILDNNDDDLT